MFHQNLMFWKSKSPVISWITGLFLLGCPDGLEPSTFRTTKTKNNCYTLAVLRVQRYGK